MSNSARTLLVTAILLGALILGVIGTQIWLQRQTAAVLTPAGGSVDEAATRQAVTRLQRLHVRSLVAIAGLAVALSSVPWLLLLLNNRKAGGDTAIPWRRDAAGLERIVRLTAERGAALAEEQGARQRAEQDLQLSRTLLDHSLDERVRLGRELHDNICQTLYAVTLTLESVRKSIAAPPIAVQRLDQCMTELRRLNQQVRSYIRGLEPDAVQGEPLTIALRESIAAATAGSNQSVEERLDEEALRLIPARHAADVVNIVREALSNSLRHGHARHLSVRAAHDGREVAVAVADDGTGFAPSAGAASGHGLANMKARATALGGRLQIESLTGRGTRVVLYVPIAPPAP